MSSSCPTRATLVSSQTIPRLPQAPRKHSTSSPAVSAPRCFKLQTNPLFFYTQIQKQKIIKKKLFVFLTNNKNVYFFITKIYIFFIKIT